MITLALIVLGLTIVDWLGSLFPDFTLPSDLTDSSGTLGGMIFALHNYVPLVDVFVGVLTLLALKIILFGWRALVFAYHQVWGSN